MGESVVELVVSAITKRKTNSEFVDLGCMLLERLLALENNIEGLAADEDIPLLLEV